jgi:HlyD family secretion protein
MKKIILGVVALGVIAATILFFANDGSAKKESDLKTVEVTRGSIVDKALAVGQIEPEREIAVKSKVAGIVRQIYVDIGDHVKVGDPLIDVKPDPTPVEFANAKREVELQQVSFDKYAAEYERMKQLRDKQLISSQEYEVALANFEDAKLRLKLSKEKLSLIESGKTEVADLTVDNTIRSPISGTVLSRLTEIGDPVVPLTTFQEGTELMTLAQMDDLVFKGTVDEIDVGKLYENMEAQIEIGALSNEKVKGVVRKISPKARQNEGATVFDIEINIEDMGKNFLRAGYSANADVIIRKAESVLVVPERLVHITDSTTTVEVQDTTGAIATRNVVTGLSDGIHIEIKEGVKEGELLVERPPREIKPWD